MNALPCGLLGLRLSNEQLRIAVSLRLGAPTSTSHSCVCGAQSDSAGQHALTCNHTKSRHSRHHELNTIIGRAQQRVTVPNKLEAVGLSRDDNKRPDGKTLTPWSHGKCLAWDASCLHRLAQSWLNISSGSGAPAADRVEQRKTNKYSFLQN